MHRNIYRAAHPNPLTSAIATRSIQSRINLLPSASRHLNMTTDSPTPQNTSAESPTVSNDQQQPSESNPTHPLPLLAPPADGSATKLDVSGEGCVVKLGHLGPVVVNQDGTVSRITNWEQMTEIERRNTP